MKGLLGDLSVEVEVQVNTASSSAKSVATRRGAGRARRIEARELWVQERAVKGELTIIKVTGENHVADVLTKHVERSKMDEHMMSCVFVRRSEHHELCPLQGDG